jgi:hypothetical protein
MAGWSRMVAHQLSEWQHSELRDAAEELLRSCAMLRGPLHNRGADGLCEACGEPFPCQTAIAIYEAVKRELEHPAAPPQSVTPPPPIVQDFQRLGNLPPCVGRTSTTAGHRCPRCLHCWESHGVPSEDGYGCMMIENSMAERAAMSDRMHELNASWEIYRDKHSFR